MSNPISNFFTWAESEFQALKSSPVVQNLEADFTALYKLAYGLIPWNTLQSAIAASVTKIATGELSSLEAHNAVLALAASFVPNANATLAQGLAATAVSVYQGILQTLPVPAPTPAATPTSAATA